LATVPAYAYGGIQITGFGATLDGLLGGRVIDHIGG
jgi:hypothetical protein